MRLICHAAGVTIALAMLFAQGAVASAHAASPAADGCEPAPRLPAASPGADLTATYHGVSTLMFSDGHERLLVDGFFSRPSTRRMLSTAIGPDMLRIKRGLGEGRPPVLAILTAHAHHDHALDGAAIAGLEPVAVVVGTPSVAKLARDRGVPVERVCAPTTSAPIVFGGYSVTPIDAPHGPSPFFLRWLLDWPLKRALTGPAWFGSYKDDRNLSFVIQHGGQTILVHPSAGQPPRDVDAETVFLGVGRFGNMSEKDALAYWQATVGSSTRTVIPIHWDRFTTAPGKSLEDTPRLLDDLKSGRERLCRYARARGDLLVLRMEADAELRLAPGRPAHGVRGVTEMCVRP